MNNFKPVLSVETSSDLCSIALMKGSDEYFSFDIRQKHIHSEKLVSMIQTVLDNASVGINELSYIALSMGPGSFTGLRIGLSAVKGMAFGAGIPICPVPTFEAFAYMISAFLPDKQTFAITRNVNVDEIYIQRFIKENNIYKADNELEIINKADFRNYISNDDLIFGNYGANKGYISITDVDAISVARWAIAFGKNLITNDFDYLEPDYIKKFEGRKPQ
jgi:tRNA threonylcarbamoyladenosine biosynthesis protein TsaB